MRNSDILSLQLELDIIKTILVEEIKSRAEIEVRTSALGDELKAANLHILEAYRQKEDKEMELNSAKSVIDALESQQIILINEVDELKKNSRSSAEQEKDEARRQVEMEMSEVIISLYKQKNELLAKQSLGEFDRIELLLDESIKTLVQKEILEQNYVSLLRGMACLME